MRCDVSLRLPEPNRVTPMSRTLFVARPLRLEAVSPIVAVENRPSERVPQVRFLVLLPGRPIAINPPELVVDCREDGAMFRPA